MHAGLDTVLEDLLDRMGREVDALVHRLADWEDEFSPYDRVGEVFSDADRELWRAVLSDLLARTYFATMRAFDNAATQDRPDRILVVDTQGNTVCDDWTAMLRQRAAARGFALPMPPEA